MESSKNMIYESCASIAALTQHEQSSLKEFQMAKHYAESLLKHLESVISELSQPASIKIQQHTYFPTSPFNNTFSSNSACSSPTSDIFMSNESGSESNSDDEREETSHILETLRNSAVILHNNNNVVKHENPFGPTTPLAAKKRRVTESNSFDSPIIMKHDQVYNNNNNNCATTTTTILPHSFSNIDLTVHQPLLTIIPHRTLSDSDITKSKSSRSNSKSNNNNAKSWKTGRKCAHCGTTETPEWRLGPNQITLCNACGLKNRYKARQEKRSSAKISIQNILNPKNDANNSIKAFDMIYLAK